MKCDDFYIFFLDIPSDSDYYVLVRGNCPTDDDIRKVVMAIQEFTRPYNNNDSEWYDWGSVEYIASEKFKELGYDVITNVEPFYLRF